jgi:hypothetical protein
VIRRARQRSRRGSLPSPSQPESLLALRSAGAARDGGAVLTGDAAPIHPLFTGYKKTMEAKRPSLDH